MTEEADWNAAYQRLRKYRKREGHCRVPLRYTEEDNYKLGDWVIRQRTSTAKGELSVERIGRLDKLGFIWDEL